MALAAACLRLLGRTLTGLPPGQSTLAAPQAPTFEMYYQIENFIPSRSAAWVLMSERAAILAARRADTTDDAVPRSIRAVAETAAAVAARLASHAPPALRPT